jgi:hypothetical protein
MPKFRTELARRWPSTAEASREAGHKPVSPLKASEQQIHQAVVHHLRQRGVKGLVFTHPPNGGYRRPAEARIFKGLGVCAGAADLLVWCDGKSFALELKAPGGRPTEAQLTFLSDMERAGAFTALAESLDCALKTLEAWGLLRGNVP